MNEECKGDDGEDGRIHFAFDRDIQTIAISAIVPLKSLPEGARESRKFAQVLSSIKAIGLVEAPVVIADTRSAGTWYLLDGHLRLEALKDLASRRSSVWLRLTTTPTLQQAGQPAGPDPGAQDDCSCHRAGRFFGRYSRCIGASESVIRRFRLLEGISPR
ncbi:ParB/RepB/Spo0J family partition protein [Sinorhizobium meliloti]|uniref:ParB/RepB/Spo0J family partition protein n=1 Tax=Rhizobium meliloti TaxID=382 RepID=UPI001F2D29AC|nr:ParB/RepB/Spo0J family partition protein [Sinorhizobium meliloti]